MTPSIGLAPAMIIATLSLVASIYIHTLEYMQSPGECIIMCTVGAKWKRRMQ